MNTKEYKKMELEEKIRPFAEFVIEVFLFFVFISIIIIPIYFSYIHFSNSPVWSLFEIAFSAAVFFTVGKRLKNDWDID